MPGIFFLIISLIFWVPWYSRLLGNFSPKTSGGMRVSIGMIPPACLLIFLVTFFSFADHSATTDFNCAISYTAFLLVTASLTLTALEAFGIQSTREIFERKNPSAGMVIAAGLLGATALNIGASLGAVIETEPRFFPLALSFPCWLISGALISGMTPLVDLVTVNRDRGAAFRFGGLWFCLSLLFAHGAAGDWTSFLDTTKDLTGAALESGALLLFAWFMETGARRSLNRVIALVIYGVLVVALLQVPLVSTLIK